MYTSGNLQISAKWGGDCHEATTFPWKMLKVFYPKGMTGGPPEQTWQCKSNVFFRSLSKDGHLPVLSLCFTAPSQVYDGSSGQSQDLLPRHQEDKRGPGMRHGKCWGSMGGWGWCQAPKLMDFRKGTTTLGFVSPVCVSRKATGNDELRVWQLQPNWGTWRMITSKASIHRMFRSICWVFVLQDVPGLRWTRFFLCSQADSNGLRFQGGIIIAVDSRASMGSYIGSATVKKARREATDVLMGWKLLGA